MRLSLIVFVSILYNVMFLNLICAQEQTNNKYRAIVSDYSLPYWYDLADEILQPFGGMKNFCDINPKSPYRHVIDLSKAEVEVILAKVPDFIERLNKLYRERLFSDDLLKSKDIVDDVYIFDNRNHQPPRSFICKFVELERGKSTKKIDFSIIKEIKVYDSSQIKIRANGDQKGRLYVNFDQEWFPKPLPENFTVLYRLTTVELIDGIVFKESMYSRNILKGNTDFGDFSTILYNLRIIFDHSKEEIEN